METARINITGIIGGKELGYTAPSFGYTDLLVALAKYPDAKQYEFVINTDGGSVAEGFRMAELIESLPNTRTIAKKVYSIGNVLFFAGQERIISDEAEAEPFMLHPAAVWGANLTQAMLNAEQLRLIADDLEETTAYIAGYISTRSGIGASKVLSLMAVDRYINAEEAVALGFKGKRKQSEVNIKNLSTQIQNIHMNVFKRLKEIFGMSQNMAVPLKDGGEIFVESEDGALLGKKAYTAEGGEPLPDGEYTLEDGRTLEVKGGVVDGESTEAGEMPDPAPAVKIEVEEDLKKQNAELMDKVASLEAELIKYKGEATANAEAVAELDKVKEERNQLSEKLNATNIVLHNVARVTSKGLPNLEGAQNLKGIEPKGNKALTREEQLAALEKAEKNGLIK